MSRISSAYAIRDVFLTALLFIPFPVNPAQSNVSQLGEEYIERWIEFYPSAAFREGLIASAYQFEDFSLQRVSDWLGGNHQIIKALSSSGFDALSLDEQIDVRILP